MLKRILLNTRKPTGILGKFMLTLMNFGHEPLSKWAFSIINPKIHARILDVGCGGGRNIRKMLRLVPHGRVCGVDYAPVSVEKSCRLNALAVAQGRAEIMQSGVSQLPYDAELFDVVTAFETVYFWQNIVNDMREVYRVLKNNGQFFICNEVVRNEAQPKRYRYFIDTIGMNVYTGRELAAMLEQAGFTDVDVIYHKSKDWVCVTGKRGQRELIMTNIQKRKIENADCVKE